VGGLWDTSPAHRKEFKFLYHYTDYDGGISGGVLWDTRPAHRKEFELLYHYVDYDDRISGAGLVSHKTCSIMCNS